MSKPTKAKVVKMLKEAFSMSNAEANAVWKNPEEKAAAIKTWELHQGNEEPEEDV